MESYEDIDLERKTAKNWREYLSYLGEMKEMLMWIWRDLMSFESKRIVRKTFVYMIVHAVLMMASPFALGLVLDGLVSERLIWGISTITLGISLLAIVSLSGVFIADRQGVNRELFFGANGYQLDTKTTSLFLGKSWAQHLKESKLLNEATIKKGYERMLGLQWMLLFDGVEGLLSLVIAYMALALLDWRAAGIVTVMLIIHLVWMLFLNQKVMEICLPIEKMWRALNRYRNERLDQVEKVKANAKENEEVTEIGQLFNQALKPDRKFWIWFIHQVTYRRVFSVLTIVAVVLYACYGVKNDLVTAGMFLPLTSWAGDIISNLWRIGHVEHQINYATPSIMTMKEALTLPVGLEYSPNPVVLPNGNPHKIEFRDVCFSYGEKEVVDSQLVLDNISFTIEPSERVALIGPTGAGKTTVMRLLLRGLDPDSGCILVDGQDLRKLDHEKWLRGVGYIAQEPQVLDGTIRYNLLYGLTPEERAKISDDYLWNIMRMLQIDFGTRLHNGLDTVVGRRGIKLSGGQNQRLMIGMAVLKNPRLMVVDEATSSLDVTTERLVQEGLEKVLTGNRNALIITHRLNTVQRFCDKFVVLRPTKSGGAVEYIGKSFDELKENSPTFQQLAEDYEIAFQGFS